MYCSWRYTKYFVRFILVEKNKIKVLHLESGLTSQKFFRPFPEELVRRIVSRFSDILICFDDDSFNNLNSKYKNSKKLIKKFQKILFLIRFLMK